MKSALVVATATLVFFAPLLAFAADPAPGSVNKSTSSYDFAEPQVLAQKAEALAKADLAKMAAAEMVYRNHVFIHVFQLQAGTNVPTYLFMKLYRSFSGYEVVDIEKTSSVLRPIKFTIRYDADRIGTRDIKASKENQEALQQAERDKAFMARDKESITRQYYCDAQGNVIEAPSPILPRPNFWIKDGKDPFGATYVLDPYNLPVGE